MGPLRPGDLTGMQDGGEDGATFRPSMDVHSKAPLSPTSKKKDIGVLRMQSAHGEAHDDGILGGGWGIEEGGHVLTEAPASFDLTPLMEAVCSNSIEDAVALLEDGPEGLSVDASGGASGETALILAAELGHEQMVALLLENLADPTLPNAIGWTALMHAAMQGHDHVASMLVAWARAQGEEAVGVVVDGVDAMGESALWKACLMGHVHVAKVLLVQGQADTTLAARTHDGSTLTPAQVAAQQGHTHILRLLQWWEEESVERVYVLAKARALSSATHHLTTKHAYLHSHSLLGLPAPLTRRLALGEALPTLDDEEEEGRGGEREEEGGEVGATVAFVTGGAMSHELYTELLQGLGL